MPELPDVTVYIEALETRIVGQPLEAVRIVSPSVLKTATPPIRAAEGRKVLRLRRIGKRIAIGLEGDLWLVLHLMIAGRLHWKAPAPPLSGKQNLAGVDFPSGSDEILHRAKLSPLALSRSLPEEDSRRLYLAVQKVLAEWIDRLRSQSGDDF